MIGCSWDSHGSLPYVRNSGKLFVGQTNKLYQNLNPPVKSYSSNINLEVYSRPHPSPSYVNCALNDGPLSCTLVVYSDYPHEGKRTGWFSSSFFYYLGLVLRSSKIVWITTDKFVPVGRVLRLSGSNSQRPFLSNRDISTRKPLSDNSIR